MQSWRELIQGPPETLEGHLAHLAVNAAVIVPLLLAMALVASGLVQMWAGQPLQMSRAGGAMMALAGMALSCVAGLASMALH